MCDGDDESVAHGGLLGKGLEGEAVPGGTVDIADATGEGLLRHTAPGREFFGCAGVVGPHEHYDWAADGAPTCGELDEHASAAKSTDIYDLRVSFPQLPPDPERPLWRA